MGDYNLETSAANPFRAWLLTQPRSVSMASLARDLDLDPSYVSDLMSEKSVLMPSLAVSVAIEMRTRGKVTPRAIFLFADANRAAQAEQKAAA